MEKKDISNSPKSPRSSELSSKIEFFSNKAKENVDDSINNTVTRTIFFKWGDQAKKAEFRGNSLKELKQLFYTKFKINKKEKRPIHISLLKEPKVSQEVKSIEELTDGCILEIKMHCGVSDKKEVGIISHYEFQRQSLALIMVGLPARGKSYTSNKICRYLRWLGIETRDFNVGNYRRERLGVGQTSKFFDPNNTEGVRSRRHMAIAALDDMIAWLHEDGATGGRAAVLDATNSTKERRRVILKRCQLENIQVCFIESICNDPEIIERNARAKTKGPDYVNMSEEEALQDFYKRMRLYEKAYQPLDETDSELSYVKIIDVGKKIIVNKIEAYLPSRIVHFLMNLHISPRPIWLTRHGESAYNLEDRIGGDPPLTDKGEEYAHLLADWVDNNLKEIDNLLVWTSTLKRSISTAQYVNHTKVALRVLDEIDAGVCDGMTYDEIAETMPQEFAARAANKLRYRYPQGESYLDVMQRLEPVLFELERQKSPVLIVAHQGVLRAIVAYFLDVEIEEVPWVEVKMHTVYCIHPQTYGTEVKEFKLLD